MLKLKCLLVFIFLSGWQQSFAQYVFNESLRRELDSLFVEDQRYRKWVGVNIDSTAIFFKIPKDSSIGFIIKK